MIKLNSINYTHWKNLVEDMLYIKDLYVFIGVGKGKTSNKSDVEKKKMNQKIVAIIRRWLDLSVYPHVEAKTNVRKMWIKLKELYERKNV